jgi:NAD(P)-dependent dehydrogenase (short-subunit alcohol dehydrogenase family)
MTRLALVMGANGGIGSAICERSRADGVHVRTMDAVGRADVVADLSADAILPWTLADADICVSVAGVVNTSHPHSMSAEKCSRDIDVNLTGAFRVIQGCLPGMPHRRFGRLGAAGKVAYAASKAGLHGRCGRSPSRTWLRHHGELRAAGG